MLAPTACAKERQRILYDRERTDRAMSAVARELWRGVALTGPRIEDAWGSMCSKHVALIGGYFGGLVDSLISYVVTSGLSLSAGSAVA